MKLLRHGQLGKERPGLLDESGRLRDLSAVIQDLSGVYLSQKHLQALKTIDSEKLPLVPAGQRIGPPVAGTRNFICVGLNYKGHAAETGASLPDEPIIFLKSLNSISGPHDAIPLPFGSTMTDWEIELGIVIGTLAKRVAREKAMDHVAGYTIVNDVSERDWQMNRGGTWDKGKGFDGFGPVGPWLVTTDEIADVQSLALTLAVDGRVMQQGNTADMIFGVADVVSYISSFITLHPGDIISTGTPPGVGHAKKPPTYLHAGQVIKAAIDGLGSQSNLITEPS